MKYIKRLFALPFVFGYVFIHHVFVFIKSLLMFVKNFMLYGGEFIRYEKDDRDSLHGIFEELKKQYKSK